MLTLGMQGSDVTILQRDLSALSFGLPASGRFNQLTLQRLKAFQHRYGLTVDGIAGPTTITELKRLLNRKLHLDPAKEEFIGDDEANGLRAMPSRKVL